MDNVLADEFGSTPRPGITGLLKQLKEEGHELLLWTNSKSERARGILVEHGLAHFFTHCVYREDYDPENRGISKDIRKVSGDLLVDDDPAEIAFVKSLGLKGVRVKPFRKGKPLPKNDIEDIHTAITKSQGFLSRIFS